MRALLFLLVAGCAVPRFRIEGPVPGPGDPALDTALYQTVGQRFLPGHAVELLDDARVFDALVEEIARARQSINVVLYIWERSEPGARLINALRARPVGVACRVVADPLGSPHFSYEVAPALHEVGCETHLFRSIARAPLGRTHRKIAVFDGRVGIVGGFGVRDDWVARPGKPAWRDMAARVRGPVVSEMQRAFAQNWLEVGGALLPPSEFPEIAPDGPSRCAHVSSTRAYVSDGERLVHLVIGSAKRRLYIWSAYFAPDRALTDLLARKRREGVDVRILVPGRKNDVPPMTLAQRASYGRLLGAGVRIFELEPVMMHAKVMLVDDQLSLVGSIDLQNISLRSLEESALVIDDPAFARTLESRWQADMTRSRDVTR